MTPVEAAQILGVRPEASADEVRGAYRTLIRRHHPDRAGASSGGRAASITEAYRVLTEARHLPPQAAPTAPRPGRTAGRSTSHRGPGPGQTTPEGQRHEGWPGEAPAWSTLRGTARPGPLAPLVRRLDGDSLLMEAPADETFRWLLDAAHDIGEITYVDRSMPIMEVLCRFEGEPATSLLLTLQGRGGDTEVFCTVESIEARPAPPTDAVVDLLELALHRRRAPEEYPPDPGS